VAVDTSVAVPLLSKAHVFQPRFSDWAQGKDLWLSGHAAVETFAVLTRLTGGLALAALDVIRLLDETFVGALDLPDTAVAVRTLARMGITGGATYDGLVALAAKEHKAILATHDARALATYQAVGVAVTLVSPA